MKSILVHKCLKDIIPKKQKLNLNSNINRSRKNYQFFNLSKIFSRVVKEGIATKNYNDSFFNSLNK